MCPRFSRRILTVATGLLACLLVACDSSITPLGGTEAVLNPLFVTSVDPPPGRIELGPGFHCRVTFSEPLDLSTLEGALEVVDTATGIALPGSLRIEPGAIPPREAVVWQPEPDVLVPGRPFSLVVADTIRSEEGAPIDLESEECAACPTFPYETFQVRPELSGTVVVLVTSCSSAELCWDTTTVSDNTPREEIAYRVLLAANGSPLDPTDFALETAPGVTRAFLEDLEPSTSYEVAVTAVDAVDNTSPPSGATRFETPRTDRCDPIPPVFSGVSELEVRPADPQVIVARWAAGEDNETAAADLRYNVYLALESGAQDFAVPFQTSEPGAEEIRITGLPTNATHFVVVRALDATGNEDANGVELAATTPSSLRLNVQPILNQRSPEGGGCTAPSCHAAPVNSGSLNLETFEGLVTIGGATRNPPTVIPGDSENSFLLWRIDESNPEFRRPRMPLNRDTPLTSAQLDAVRRWIDQGALDN